jgi:hypothetical protein
LPVVVRATAVDGTPSDAVVCCFLLPLGTSRLEQSSVRELFGAAYVYVRASSIHANIRLEGKVCR